MKPCYAGIDGCKAGWFCIMLADDQTWAFEVIADAQQIAARLGSAKTVLIDIPIGLIETGEQGRACDTQARKLLGRKRASSVFAPPARQTLAAKNYQHALTVNRTVTSRGLSKQAWNIAHKIHEIDLLVQTNTVMRSCLRESHPELCLWALNNGEAMAHNKKTREGREERLTVLERFFPAARSLLQQAASRYRRRQVALDDIVDALVIAVVARCGEGRYNTLPDEVQVDAKGLPMEMVYWRPNVLM